MYQVSLFTLCFPASGRALRASYRVNLFHQVSIIIDDGDIDADFTNDYDDDFTNKYYDYTNKYDDDLINDYDNNHINDYYDHYTNEI